MNYYIEIFILSIILNKYHHVAQIVCNNMKLKKMMDIKLKLKMLSKNHFSDIRFISQVWRYL